MIDLFFETSLYSQLPACFEAGRGKPTPEYFIAETFHANKTNLACKFLFSLTCCKGQE